METKQMKVMFLFLSVIMALLCRHQSEAQAPIQSETQAPIQSETQAPVPSPDECFTPIKTVKGCLDAVKDAFKGHFKGLGKECCQVIASIDDGCLPIIFPGKPFIVFLVKAACNIKAACDFKGCM
ncbi:hypothetical protein V5N11_018026 [Cardamine amara subsp. amara]|uniref:Prolamin-like domain-containing protein n=1 Tax=Cardamine amara subsp. amara TaxID=228776 RepID=A0ABD1AGR4_CARAN